MQAPLHYLPLSPVYRLISYAPPRHEGAPTAGVPGGPRSLPGREAVPRQDLRPEAASGRGHRPLGPQDRGPLPRQVPRNSGPKVLRSLEVPYSACRSTLAPEGQRWYTVGRPYRLHPSREGHLPPGAGQ